ncbi:MAG: hypothetical protein ACO1NS_15115 [Daejeonella sp.]|uniref:hypothetical protein n=1 Tax=Daejeonella sp. JGW-45 TaxID=3034148 RepID=UPI0023EA83FB|nr:hypothetical protein [Daejeonella sp. JGW-45]
MLGNLVQTHSCQFRDGSGTVPGRLREIAEAVPDVYRIIIPSVTDLIITKYESFPKRM